MRQRQNEHILGGVGIMLMFVISPIFNGIGTLLSFILQLPAWFSVLMIIITIIVYLIGYIMLFLAIKKLSNNLSDKRIFDNFLWGVLILFIGSILLGIVGGTVLGIVEGLHISSIAIVGGVLLIMGIFLFYVIFVAHVYFYKKSFHLIYEHKKVELFKFGGSLLFWGSIGIIAFGLGFIVMYIAWILIMIAFFQLPVQYESSAASGQYFMIKPDNKVVGGVVVSFLVFALFAWFLWHRHEEYMHTIYECQVNSHYRFLVMPAKKTMTQFISSSWSGTTTQEYNNCKERGDYLLCLTKEFQSDFGKLQGYFIFSEKDKNLSLGFTVKHVKKDKFIQGCIGELNGTIYKKIPGMTICLVDQYSHIPCTKTTY